MRISSATERYAQALVAARGADGVVDEAEARSLVEQLKRDLPVLGDAHAIDQARVMASLWFRLHPRDYFLDVDGQTKSVRSLPSADLSPAACDVLNEFAATLPPLPGVEPEFATPLRFGEFERHLLTGTPDFIVRRSPDGVLRFKPHELRSAVEIPSQPPAGANGKPATASKPDGAPLGTVAGAVEQIAFVVDANRTRGSFVVDLAGTPLAGVSLAVVAGADWVALFFRHVTPTQRTLINEHRRDVEAAIGAIGLRVARYEPNA